MTFSEWLNKTQMVSFGAFCNQIVFGVVVLGFSAVGSILLLDDSSAAYLKQAPDIRAGAQTHESNRQSYGMQIATAIMLLVGGKLVTNAASQHSNRATSKEYIEAKERGQVAGVAAAAAAAQLVASTKATDPQADGIVTAERPAMRPSKQVNVVVEGDEQP